VSTVQQVELRDGRWTSFVASQPEATAFHAPSWAEMLCECYGFRSFALASTDEHGVAAAGIPVIELPASLHRRPRWVSLPFTDICPPLARGSEREAVFVKGLEETRKAAGVDRFEIRSRVSAPGAHLRSTAVRHTLELDPDEQAVLRRLDTSQVQRNIKRARREGVVVRIAERESDLDRTFFDLQVETRRRLGVPVQPRRFYTLLWRRLIEAGEGFLLLAYAGRRPIAGGVFLHGRRSLTYKYGASSRAHWHLRPNVLLFWTAIQMACSSGVDIFDFGRTDLKNEGLRTFKRNWGTREEPLIYTTLGSPARRISAGLEPALSTLIRHSPSWVCKLAGAKLYHLAA
jgi:CelD/BcsL family acetyltransferase involved in cellulose biosynthesis